VFAAVQKEHAMEKRKLGKSDLEVSAIGASQFSREYGRYFGNPPTRDIARLREGRLAGAVAEGVER
jgi:hypothetical protein